jgi:hypothetical protein
MVSINEIAKEQGFSGSAYHKYADLRSDKDITIDESESVGHNINTRVDCYVAGSYISRGGKSLEVKQRYTIYVSYGARTQQRAMARLRSEMIMDFERNFPQFHVTDIFIPEDKFVIPPGMETSEFYYGSELFKRFSRLDVKRYKLETEREIYGSRMKSIKKRYG